MPLSVCIADDHPLFGQALESVLIQHSSDWKVHRITDVDALHRYVQHESSLDLLMLDLHMPGAVGFSTLSWVRAQRSALPVVMISANTHPETVRRAIDHGASAFLSKSAESGVIVDTLERVMAGEKGLHPELEISRQGESLNALDAAEAIASMTAQQMRVASMLVEGQLNKQIAYELGVKEATIKAHMTEIFRKLGVHSRTQAVLVLNRLIPESSEEHDQPPARDNA